MLAQLRRDLEPEPRLKHACSTRTRAVTVVRSVRFPDIAWAALQKTPRGFRGEWSLCATLPPCQVDEGTGRNRNVQEANRRYAHPNEICRGCDVPCESGTISQRRAPIPEYNQAPSRHENQRGRDDPCERSERPPPLPESHQQRTGRHPHVQDAKHEDRKAQHETDEWPKPAQGWVLVRMHPPPGDCHQARSRRYNERRGDHPCESDPTESRGRTCGWFVHRLQGSGRSRASPRGAKQAQSTLVAASNSIHPARSREAATQRTFAHCTGPMMRTGTTRWRLARGARADGLRG